MKTLIGKTSIVRKIWSTTDITLFIFAGASAEFALNRQVHWLYFTGKLPANPVGRLFSTIRYAQQIIFSEEGEAVNTISKINKIHQGVELARGRSIPATAYKDVLYMLIYYSITAFELLEKKLTIEEKDEIVATFAKIGSGMNIQDIPGSYFEWVCIYKVHLNENLEDSSHTRDLFKQYRRQLGAFRYFILLEIQRVLVNERVNRLLRLGRPLLANWFIPAYKSIREYKVSKWLIYVLVPNKFLDQLKAMDKMNTSRATVEQYSLASVSSLL
ncbi:MAG TPA: oxygenase MpaB family protein [Chryseolinea sp.]|nr:oxygenase MpaB family protein [Chryseolinea sp.]